MFGTVQDITERKRAEESLRLSEERFAKAFNASPEPISIYRYQDGVILEVNERWTSVYGYTREEAIGHTSLELNLIEPGCRETVRDLLEKQGSMREYEMEFRTKWGEIRHSSVSAEQIVLNNELCHIFLHRDITERRRAEHENRKLIHNLGERVKELTALHHTARMLRDESRSVPELLQEIVSLLPPAWQYPEVTAARIILGGKEFKTPNFSQTQWSQVAQFTAGNLQGAIEVVYLEERPEEDAGPFLSEERNLIDSLAEMISSTLNQRFTQGELRVSEERFAKAFKASPVPIAIVRDRDRTFLEVNDRWETVFGYSREETIGRTSLELKFLDVEDRDRLRALGERQDFLRDEEVTVRTKQGELRHVTMSSERFMNNEELCDIYLISDITERKRGEERLKVSHEQLRALSESLRRAKEEEGVRIARELHDELGSALTSMKWSLLKLEEVSSEGAREKIAEMVGLVDSTINTVRRISSELRPGVLDDLGLVAAIEWHAQQFQEHTGIVCRLDSLVDNVELSLEQATAVFRIFQEAMTNVLRHAGATKVNVIMEEEEGEFVLEIKDNGRGITESERSGIQSLGLLGMRERAHAAGGKVEVNGTAGKGTVVIVRLPTTGDKAS
jgi:PAS domain S-box-containing protein